MRTRDKNKMKELTETRKNQILDAASIVFVKEGFSNANTDEIAKVANLGKGTIYRYFKNKRDLFLSVADRGLDRLKDIVIKEIEKAEDPIKKIETAIKTYISFFEENSNLIGILIHEQSSFQKRIAKRYFEHYYGSVDKMKQIFKEGIKKGLVKEDLYIEGAINVLTSMLNGLIYRWQLEGKRYKLSDYTPVVLKIFFTGALDDKKRRKEY